MRREVVTYCGIYTLFTILDKYRNLASAGGFQDFGELRDGLLEDLGRADVDLCDYDEDGDVEGEGYAEMFSVTL